MIFDFLQRLLNIVSGALVVTAAAIFPSATPISSPTPLETPLAVVASQSVSPTPSMAPKLMKTPTPTPSSIQEAIVQLQDLKKELEAWTPTPTPPTPTSQVIYVVQTPEPTPTPTPVILWQQQRDCACSGSDGSGWIDVSAYSSVKLKYDIDVIPTTQIPFLTADFWQYSFSTSSDGITEDFNSTFLYFNVPDLPGKPILEAVIPVTSRWLNIYTLGRQDGRLTATLYAQ